MSSRPTDTTRGNESQAVEDRWPSFFVTGRRHQAPRLVVEPDAHRFAVAERLPVNRDSVGLTDVQCGTLYGRAIHGHAACRNHPFGVAAGCNAVASQNLGNPFACNLGHGRDLPRRAGDGKSSRRTRPMESHAEQAIADRGARTSRRDRLSVCFMRDGVKSEG